MSGIGYAIIIDSKGGTRRLDNTRSKPSSLKLVDTSRTALDWVLYALSNCGIHHIIYVGGYHIEKVIERYPDLSYRFHADWRQRGELAGLYLGRLDRAANCLVVRADTICMSEAVHRLISTWTCLAAGYYSDGTKRIFAGLIALPASVAGKAFAIAEDLSRRDSGSGLEEWLSTLTEEGLPTQAVNLDGLAAPSGDPAAVARAIFSGKGQALGKVGLLVKSAVVLDQVRFRTTDWLENPESILAQVRQSFATARVVIRSNASAEDGLEESAAGSFDSVLGVHAAHQEDLRAAIDRVVRSYTKNGRVAHDLDEVLVQPEVDALAVSGVLLTRDLETNAPYYVLNLDRQSGRSDAVTSGAPVRLDTLYVSRKVDISHLTSDALACIRLARELEELTHLDALDIEFGIDRRGTVFLFQVRPIGARARKFRLADDDLFDELERIAEFLDVHLKPHPTLLGDTTVLGTMPDWNPAEMIGTAPRPLALSLYQRLIGDRAWAAGRAIIGYRDVRPEPLIVALGGRPYVDVRASMNSFLAAGLDDQIAETWVDRCLGMVRADRRLHDKIEFEVAITCLAFDFDDHVQRLRQAGLTEAETAEFRVHLLKLTDGILSGQTAPINAQLAHLDELARRREHWLQARVSSYPALARQIDACLSDCERYGTTPFAVLARYAFIAVNLLRSLHRVGVLSGDELETIMRSIPTVASELSRDIALHATGGLATSVILERYGHLRPSSYDITAPNYATAWETYLRPTSRDPLEASYPDTGAAARIMDARAPQIDALLRSAGFTASAAQLRDFVLGSIPARERSKFEFMKSVNVALEAIARVGGELGFSRDEMSFLPIDLIVRGAKDSASSAVHAELRRSINFHQKRWNLTYAIRLPHLIQSVDDVTAFQIEEWTPNFVSTRRVVAPPVVLESGVPGEALDGKIVLIRAADPGYDWLFGHPIAGLITQYGGVASHMAIRAAEFGLSAAIGCGEVIFERLRQARLIELDCGSKKVRAIS